MSADKTHLIYCLQSPKKEHNLYVGQTKDWDRREKEHKSGDRGCPGISRAIKKYKWKNIKHIVLIEGLTLEQANYWEEHYISIFDSFHNGYNLTSGGNNYEFSQKSRDRIAAKMTGNTNAKGKRSAEFNAQNSKRNMGKKHALGCKHPPRTDGWRAKQRVAQKAAKTKQWQDPEVKAKHKAAMNRPEVKAKISKASLGNTYCLGHKHTEETKVKMTASKMGDKNPMKIPEVKAKHKAAYERPEVKSKMSARATGQNNPNSATNRRRRFIAKCFDGGVYNWH